jgi:hypothetical protein
MRNKDTILLEDAYNSIHNKPTEAMAENEEAASDIQSKVGEIDQMVQTLNQDVNVDSINAVTKMTNDLVRSGKIEHALVLWRDLKNKLDRDKLEATLTMSVNGDYDVAAKDEFLNKSLPAIRKILNP